MKDPKNFQKFFEFWEKDGPGMNELRQHMDSNIITKSLTDFNNWFGTKGEDYSKTLKEFLRDGTGGSYVLWYYKEDLNPEEVPVCHLGSEGTVKVIAGNFNEFLQIYAGGWLMDIYEEEDKFYKPEEHIADLQEKNKFQTGLSHLVKWIKNECNLEPVTDPVKFVKAAKAKIPDFNKWVEEKIPY